MEDVEGDSVIRIQVPTDVCDKRERRKHRKTLVEEVFYDYATNTTLHGLSYTTKKNVTLKEKIFWIITFISSLFICGHVIGKMWIKWQTRPIIVTISETLVPVTEVPFPSVTICPQTKVKKSVYNYSLEVSRLRKILTNHNDSEENINKYVMDNIEDYVKLEDLSQICLNGQEVFSSLRPHTNFTTYEKNKLLYTSVAENIKEVAPTIEDIFFHCSQHGRRIPCKRILSKILTSEGLCYNVNSLAAHDLVNDDTNISFSAKKNIVNWTLRDGYTYYSPNAYPTPGKEMDGIPDLFIVLQDDLTDNDEVCNINNIGFTKIFVQHPTDLPQSTQYFSAVQNGETTSLVLSFNLINSTQEISDYAIEKRQCYFPNDRKLKYFKIYTENNCMMECNTNITYNRHKCVYFYMPHENGTRICTLTEYKKDKVDDSYTTLESITQCHCLPSCYSIEYQTETLKTVYHLEKTLEYYNMTNFKNKKFSILRMFFKKSRFLSMRRSELFGVTDFLANIGGILSLFLGFSFLSLFELLYYLTLRFYVEYKKDCKQEKKEGSNISN